MKTTEKKHWINGMMVYDQRRFRILTWQIGNYGFLLAIGLSKADRKLSFKNRFMFNFETFKLI